MENKHDIDDNDVFYCRNCMSLAIIDAGPYCYCRTCGGTDIATAPFERWQWLYRNKYGHDLVEKNN